MANAGTYKMSPQARITPLESPIPAIPLDAISAFLVGNRVLNPEDVKAAPCIGGMKAYCHGRGRLHVCPRQWAGTG